MACARTPYSRYFGRPLVTAPTSASALEWYESRLSRNAPLGLVLLFQLALPPEVPGYLLGLPRYHFWKYLGALALAELPYAVATILSGNCRHGATSLPACGCRRGTGGVLRLGAVYAAGANGAVVRQAQRWLALFTCGKPVSAANDFACEFLDVLSLGMAGWAVAHG